MMGPVRKHGDEAGTRAGRERAARGVSTKVKRKPPVTPFVRSANRQLIQIGFTEHGSAGFRQPSPGP
jgi:hypothetical protein